MSIELDFVKQLTTTKAVKEEAELINKKHIKETYNSLVDSPFLFGKSRAEFEKLEDKIKLKFSISSQSLFYFFFECFIYFLFI